jgi:hypothetical protein
MVTSSASGIRPASLASRCCGTGLAEPPPITRAGTEQGLGTVQVGVQTIIAILDRQIDEEPEAVGRPGAWASCR